jgi:hypothetical protein
VDESDFSLAVKTQLIYQNGSRLPLDCHPYRWTIAHFLLDLAKEQLEDTQQEFPASFELVDLANDYFPFIHFDIGLALSGIIIFFCISCPGAVFPNWWEIRSI